MYVCIHTPAPAPAPAETAERCEEARGVTARGRGGEHFRAAAAAAADERGVGAGGVTARGGGGKEKGDPAATRSLASPTPTSHGPMAITYMYIERGVV